MCRPHSELHRKGRGTSSTSGTRCLGRAAVILIGDRGSREAMQLLAAARKGLRRLVRFVSLTLQVMHQRESGAHGRA
jgi:hypothetical protein